MVPQTEFETNNTSTMAPTDSSMSTTSQSGQQPTSSSMTVIPPRQSESTSATTLNGDTTGFQNTEASTTVTVAMPNKTDSEDVHTTTTIPSQSEIITTTIAGSTITDSEVSATSEKTASTTSPQSAVHTTTLPHQTEIPTITKSTSTTAATQADATGFIHETSTTKETEANSTPTDVHLVTAMEDATVKLPSSTADNELLLTTQSANSLRGNNNAAGTVVFHTSLLMISVVFALVLTVL